MLLYLMRHCRQCRADAVGLLGGAWLCFRWSPPLGVAGFWLAAVVSLVLAAGLLLPLLRKAMIATALMLVAQPLTLCAPAFISTV